MPAQLWGGTKDVQHAIDEARNDYIEGRVEKVNVDASSVSIRMPFPSPVDWRDISIYFLMVDRFNNPNADPKVTPYNKLTREFQGGTIEGIRQQLPYLQQLGIGALWLSPVLQNCTYPDTDESSTHDKVYTTMGMAYRTF